MKKTGNPSIFLVSLSFFLCLVSPAGADVSSGDVIDTSNWEKIQGLVPDPVLVWYKTGQYTTSVEELNFDPGKALPQYVYDLAESNAPKYDVNENNELVYSKTGELATDIVGLPFPKVDPKDPKAGVKIVYNGKFVRMLQGNARWPGMTGHYVSTSRHERDVEIDMRTANFLGWPGIGEMKNPKGFQEQYVLKVTSPFDLAGTAVLTWRYLGQKPDMTFGYVPAIRRVRRMSPANRSDAMFGSDFSADDTGYIGYDGKVPYFEFKLVGEGEALGMFFGKDMVKCMRDPFGTLTSAEPPGAEFKVGYQVDGWQGALWAPATKDVIFIKRPVWKIESTSKDPFYNYGKQYMWIDKEFFCGFYKQIFDHSGEHWKVWYDIWGVAVDEDEGFRIPYFRAVTIVDERAEHASAFECVHKKSPAQYFLKEAADVYSLGGFQRYCK
jgi:hypothetical protein